MVATKAEKRRGVAIDLSISLGIPLIQMALRMSFTIWFSARKLTIAQNTLSQDIVIK